MLVDSLVIFGLLISVFTCSGFGDASLPEDKNIEYIKGDTNLIISVPHDGKVRHPEIPMRKPGCKHKRKCLYGENTEKCKGKKIECGDVSVDGDLGSADIARSVFNKFFNLTGTTPSFIMNNIHRSRLDPNREIEEAAQGDEQAINAYEAYHGSIENAKENFGGKPGLLLDFHGYKDDQDSGQNSTMLGYLIDKDDLDDRNYPIRESSVRALIERTKLPAEEILFGKMSLGALFEESGYKALPSPRQPKPDGDKYFNGGYIVRTHGSRNKGNVDAIQLEFPSWIRSHATDDMREEFCEKLAKNIVRYYIHFYHLFS